MANKPVTKYRIKKNIFMEMLKEKGLSIRKLETLPTFDYSVRSVARALQTERMSYTLASSLANVFEISVISFIRKVG